MDSLVLGGLIKLFLPLLHTQSGLQNSSSKYCQQGHLGEPSKPKNGEKRDIVQKGGRGLGQNPSFKLSRKNDMSSRREGAMM